MPDERYQAQLPIDRFFRQQIIPGRPRGDLVRFSAHPADRTFPHLDLRQVHPGNRDLRRDPALICSFKEGCWHIHPRCRSRLNPAMLIPFCIPLA